MPYTNEGLKKRLMGGFEEIKAVAQESKYFRNMRPELVTQAIVNAAMPFLKTPEKAVAFARLFMTWDGQHTTIREYAHHHEIMAFDIPTLFAAIDFRVDSSFGGLAQQAGAAIFEAALDDLERVTSLSPKKVCLRLLSASPMIFPKNSGWFSAKRFVQLF